MKVTLNVESENELEVLFFEKYDGAKKVQQHLEEEFGVQALLDSILIKADAFCAGFMMSDITASKIVNLADYRETKKEEKEDEVEK